MTIDDEITDNVLPQVTPDLLALAKAAINWVETRRERPEQSDAALAKVFDAAWFLKIKLSRLRA
jgi:hypothetical protein